MGFYCNDYPSHPSGLSVTENLCDLDKRVNDNQDNLGKKTELYGDHKGTWQGYEPVEVDVGLQAVVNSHNDIIKNNREIIYNLLNPPTGLSVPNRDGVTDDSAIINDFIDYISNNGGGVLYIPKGHYFLGNDMLIKSNVTVLGSGKGTIIDFKTGLYKITTPTPNIKTLTQTNDLNIGDSNNSIINTAQKGDFVLYKNNKRFTEEWDNGNPIRDYYVNAELFRINDSTSTVIEFEGQANLDQPVASSFKVETFTPVENIGVKNLKVRRDLLSTGESYGVVIAHAYDFEVKNIYTEHMNHSGVYVNKSIKGVVDEIDTVGGTIDLGLNYGVAVGNGSKFVKVTNIKGKNHRHIISGGGNGEGIPMFIDVSNVYCTNSLHHSIDTHGNTMNWTFNNIHVDNGISISGIGHQANNMTSEKGMFELYEGGRDMYFNNIYFNSCDRMYSGNTVHNVVIDNMTVYAKDISVMALTKVGSTGVVLNNLKLVNKAFLTVTTTTQADETIPSLGVGVILRDKYKLLNSHIEGFPQAFSVNGKGCTIENIDIVNCGWLSSHLSYDCAFYVSLDATGTHIDNIIVSFNKEGVDNTSSYIYRLENTGGGTGKNITITNIKHGADHTQDWGNSVKITSNFTELFIMNNRLNGSGSVSGTGKFIYNTMIADN